MRFCVTGFLPVSWEAMPPSLLCWSQLLPGAGCFELFSQTLEWVTFRIGNPGFFHGRSVIA